MSKLSALLAFLLAFFICIISNDIVVQTTYYLGLSFIGLFIYRRIIQTGELINEMQKRTRQR